MNTRGSAVRMVLVWVLLVGWAALVVAAGIWASPDSTPFVRPVTAVVVAAVSILILVLALVPSANAWAAQGKAALAVLYRLAGIVAGGAIALVVVGFKWGLIGTGTKAPPFPISISADGTLPPGRFDDLLTFARSLTYDDYTHGTADSGYVVDDSGFTLKAWIAPAQRADFIRYEDLGPGKGRVVARIRIDTTGGRGYRPLGLPPGVSYLWVDNLQIKDTTGTFRAFIIPDRPGAQFIPFKDGATFTYLRSSGKFANLPMARWLLHGSSCFNTSCSHGCCRVCP
jgi:hypothetical protein